MAAPDADQSTIRDTQAGNSLATDPDGPTSLEAATELDGATALDTDLNTDLNSPPPQPPPSRSNPRPASPPSRANRPGDYKGMHCGPYQIIREIGRGGMGTVFLAARADDEYKKRVALKILSGFASDAVLRRFRHERQILASLEHPNIARLMDGGSTDSGEPYFVMDYVEGTPIDVYCDSHKLDVPDRIQLFRQLCSAVQYVHRNLVVHRDLKPGNVLVTANGTVKLLDFGIAKILRDDMSFTLADATRAREMLMTPAYASPEQAKGEPITTASDVYTLGVILYELLTGYRPYRVKGGDALEMIRVICEEVPSKPSTAVTTGGRKAAPEAGSTAKGEKKETIQEISQKRSTTPAELGISLKGDLDNILMMALRKEPQRRYATVEAFSLDLERHLSDFPVQAHEDSWSYRNSKFMRRNRVALTAVGLGVLALIIGLASTTFEWNKARHEKLLADSRFQDVRSLATRFLFEVNDSVQDLQGATHARSLIASTGTEYLDRLAAEAHGDLSLQRELAEGYRKIGDVEGNPFNSNLGQTKPAIESYRKAIATGQAVLKRDPHDLQTLRGVAASHLALSGVLGFSGDVAGGYEAGKQAVDESKQLVALQPASAEAKFDLSRALEALGDVAGGMQSISLGRASEASADYRQSLDALPSLLPSDPLAPRASRARAVLLWKSGGLEWRAGHAADAIAHAKEALALAETLMAAAPDSSKARQLEGAILESLGTYFQGMGQSKDALAAYLQAAKYDQINLKADPFDARTRDDVMVTEKNLGDLYFHNLFKWPEALQCYQTLESLLAARIAADPGNNVAQDRLAVNESYLASTLLYLGHEKEAREQATKSLILARKLADRPGASFDELYDFVWLATTMEPDDLQQARQAIPYGERAVALNPQNPAALNVLGAAYLGSGDKPHALAAFQRGLALFPPAKPGQPIPAQQRILGDALTNLLKPQALPANHP